MDWNSFFMILVGVPVMIAVCLGWMRLGMRLESKIGEGPALAFCLGTVILTAAIIVGLFKW